MKSHLLNSPEADFPVNMERMALNLARRSEGEQAGLIPGVEDSRLLRDILCFIARLSHQAGGLRAYAESLIARRPERFVTAAMLKAGAPGPGGRHSFEQMLPIWREACRFESESSACCAVRGWFAANLQGWIVGTKRIPRSTDERYSPSRGEYVRTEQAYPHEEEEKGLAEYNWAFFVDLCQAEARSKLHHFLRHLAEGIDYGVSDLWYCQGLVQMVQEDMTELARQVEAQIVPTEVTSQVFRGLRFAWKKKAFVIIRGDPRIGKTYSLRWAEMYPGRALFVAVPSSDSLRDLLVRIAEKLGVQTPETSRTFKLRTMVRTVLKHTGLMLCLDESQFLIPQRFSRLTAPERLDWLRTEVIDEHFPCVLCCTPQSFDAAQDRFVSKTQHHFEQFTGRPNLIIDLPNPKDVPIVDVESVVRLSFPECGDEMVGKIAARIVSTPGFLNTIPALSNLADFIAEERGEGTQRTEADIQQALDKLAPSVLVAVQQPGVRPRGRDAGRKPPQISSAAALPQGGCRPGAAVVQTDRDRQEIFLSEPRPRGVAASAMRAGPVDLTEA